jgi:phosphatidate cytidylyltransferase
LVAGRVDARRHDVRRIYPALLFIPLFYVIVRMAPPVVFFFLVLGAALIATYELIRLHFQREVAPGDMGLGLTLTTVLVASFAWPTLFPERIVLTAAVIAVLSARLLSPRGLTHGVQDTAVVLLGGLYIGLTLGHLVLTRALEHGALLIFYLFLVAWAGDTGAYYAGVSLGRHKLAPSVSPNKTVEGMVGGAVLAVLAAFIARAWFVPDWTITDCVATGLLLTAAGTLGDLAESALKRSAGVKDSGAIIPAHGGMLDRLDSLLFAAPVFYYYLVLVKGYTPA